MDAVVNVEVRSRLLLDTGGRLANGVLLPVEETFVREGTTVQVTLTRFTDDVTEASLIANREVRFVRELEAGIDDQTYFLERMREAGMVTTGIKTGWSPESELWGIAWSIGQRLATLGRAPKLISRLRESRFAQLFPDPIALTCGGVAVLTKRSGHATPGPFPQHLPMPFTEAVLREALSNTPAVGEAFVVRADAAMSDPYGSRWFLADLCTAMETASYACFRTINPAMDAPNFSPKKYLGRTNVMAKLPSLFEVDPVAYAGCCELWGARHEMLHNGSTLVRIYNPATEDVDRGVTRTFNGVQDRGSFRSAVLAALKWLR